MGDAVFGWDRSVVLHPGVVPAARIGVVGPSARTLTSAGMTRLLAVSARGADADRR